MIIDAHCLPDFYMLILREVTLHTNKGEQTCVHLMRRRRECVCVCVCVGR